MNSSIKSILIFLIIFSLFPSNSFAIDDESIIEEIKTVKIGGDNYFPPFEYVDKNGVYKGFNVDIIRAIAIETGLDIEIHPMPWFQTLLSLSNGNIDAIQGMKYSTSRDHFYEFSDPLLISSQAIFVLSDNQYIINLEDLDGKKISIQKNDAALDSLKDYKNIKFVETENQEMALNKLIEGEVQAFVGNRQAGQYIVQKNGYRDLIKIVGEEILPLEYSIAVLEDNSDLLKVFNKGLERIQTNGVYDKIYKKWFGESLSIPTSTLKRILYITLLGLLLSLIVIYIFYKWNYLLKKEVHRRTEALYRESSFKEQTLNSIFSALITFDSDGYILSANEKMLGFISYPIENLIGEHFKNTTIKDFFYEEDFYKVLKTKKERMNVEKTLQNGDIKRIFEYNLYPLSQSDNDIYGITLTFKDITEEKLMRDKLIIQDKMESLGRLVAGIAHELRNPLTSIKTYIELIPTKYDNKDFRQKISEDVPEEIERLNNIITSLLEYSKPREPKKELLDIYNTIQDTLSFFSNQFHSKHIQLVLNIQKNIFIYVDKQQFKQVVINLLLNAIQAIEGTENPKIMLYTQLDYPYINIVVKDNGCGINSNDINRIFEPFFSTKETGTGLGLSISYQFIKENDGDIHAESHVDKGTSMYMKFPSLVKEGSVVNV